MKISILLALFCSINIVGFAQESLLGRVIDSRSKKAIADVSIINEETFEVSKSNALGYFQFKGDSGNHLSFQKQNYFESKYLIKEQKNILLALERSRLYTPEYRLGNNSFYNFISDNIQFPKQAMRMGIEGKLLVSFDIDTLGRLTNVYILKGLMKEIDEEAIRVLKQLPSDWVPSYSSYNFVLPITFRYEISAKKFISGIDLSDRKILNDISITATRSGNLISMSNATLSEFMNSSLDYRAFTIEEAMQINAKTKLILQNRSLKKLPTSIGNVKHIKSLDIEGNNIDTLPDEIGLLNNLKEINAKSNMITTIPRSFSAIKELTMLRLGQNKFEVIPDVIFEMSTLEILDLAENELISVPAKINSLTQLKELDLSNNKLESLPNSMAELTNLEKLYLNGNMISKKEIKELKRHLKSTEIFP
jgi:TonB family protein